MADIPKWRVQGDWFDTCKCSVPCADANHRRLRRHPGVAYPHRELRRRGPGRTQRTGAWVFQREHLGRTVESVDGVVSRRTRRRETAGSAADDLRRPRWRLAWHVREFHRRGARDGIRAHRFSRRRGPGVVASRDSRQSEVECRSDRRTHDTAREARAGVQRRRGCETGPGGVATYGKSTADQADAFGFKWDRKGWSSKHIGFDWSGPDA
jgi:hypothetical protein